MNGILGGLSVVFLVLTVCVMCAGEILMREAKKSDKKIGIPLSGFAKDATTMQYTIHVVAAFFIAGIWLLII